MIFGRKPEFKVCTINRFGSVKIIIYTEDIIMKVTPWPLCNKLTKVQSENFNKDYNKKNVKNVWNYAFENFVGDWKTQGGCVVVPQCGYENCNTVGCQRHKKQNVANENWPTKWKVHHTCDSNRKRRVALLSSHQMIVHQFLKTQSIHQMKLHNSDEQLLNNVVNQIENLQDDMS